MERRLALWVGVPFLAVAWSLIAVVALAPGLINSRLLMLLLLALSVTGILILAIRIVLRGRANGPLFDALYPVAGILVAIGIGFHGELGAFARGVFDYVMQDNPVSDGMHFARADDGHFHVSLTVEGSAVDFMVDVDAPFTMLRPDALKQMAVNPSSLVYNQQIELAGGSAHYAADVVLPKVRLGASIIENVPAKVFATGRWDHNILGKPFFDGLNYWRIDGDTLVIVQ
ncbi:MAG TPA: TIGR02281 family clan AA aspartic protease [Dongiaceae bacterium]|nr:TIGR02281 family clan AA aspartic protease [Dongiaceae bacterium]